MVILSVATLLLAILSGFQLMLLLKIYKEQQKKSDAVITSVWSDDKSESSDSKDENYKVVYLTDEYEQKQYNSMSAQS